MSGKRISESSYRSRKGESTKYACLDSSFGTQMTAVLKSHCQLAPMPLRRSRSYHLALTAIALGVHAMSASAQTKSEPSLGAEKLAALDSSFGPGRIYHEQLRAPLVGGLQREMGRATYSGAAQGPERVEIRQSGRLIRSTVVPEGPFTLRDLELGDRTSAVEVTTVDCDGNRHTDVVAAASLFDAVTPEPASHAAPVPLASHTAPATMASYTEPATTPSYAPRDVVAEHVRSSQNAVDDGAVQTFPIASTDIEIAPLPASPSASPDLVAERTEDYPGVSSGDAGQAPLVASVGVDRADGAPVDLPSKSELDIRVQPVSVAALKALSYPVDTVTAYAMVVGTFGRAHLARGEKAAGSRVFQSAANPLPLNVANNLGAISKSKARAVVAWSPETRAPEPYAYSSNDSVGEAAGERRLPDAWGREFARANMLPVGPGDAHARDDSSAAAPATYAAAEPVPLTKISDRVLSSGDLALIGMGHVSLNGEPLPYEVHAWAGSSQDRDAVHAGEPTLRRYAEISFTAAYARS
ncbi:fimbria/pilus outer membrane usher protein [Trinickia sp. YCB016]